MFWNMRLVMTKQIKHTINIGTWLTQILEKLNQTRIGGYFNPQTSADGESSSKSPQECAACNYTQKKEKKR